MSFNRQKNTLNLKSKEITVASPSTFTLGNQMHDYSRGELGTIGWGLKKIEFSQPIKPNPEPHHLRLLDKANSSKFIDFLQDKNSEMKKRGPSVHHPKMFYLTGNKSTVRSFSPKFRIGVKCDLKQHVLSSYLNEEK